MREFPIFVPCGDTKVAAVVTTPDEVRAREIAVVLTGVGLHPVVGSALAMRLAASLASRGVATLRLDYAGVGDSTGLVRRWSMPVIEEAFAQTKRALAIATDAVGASSFVAVGTCLGARLALELARDPACSAAVALAPPPCEPRDRSEARSSTRGRLLVRYARRSPLLRKLLGVPARAVRQTQRPSALLLRTLESALSHARLLVVYSESRRDHFSPHILPALDQLRRRLPAADADRLELTLSPVGPLTAFESLAPETKQRIVDLVLGWLEPSLATNRAAAAPVGLARAS